MKAWQICCLSMKLVGINNAKICLQKQGYRGHKKRHLTDSSCPASTSKMTKVTRPQKAKATSSNPCCPENECFFCGKGPMSGCPLQRASTFNIDTHVRQCAIDLQDTALLAKVAVGDMISIEAQYHNKCLVALYNRHRSYTRTQTSSHPEESIHGIVFAELVAYIEETKSSRDIPVFKLADLSKLYNERLADFGLSSDHVHTTRLKNRLLAWFPDMQEQKKGRDVLLMFSDDIAGIMQKVYTQNDFDNDAMVLVKAAQIVRKDMLSSKLTFEGTFKPNCQDEAVPQSLQALVNMILEGPNIKHQTRVLSTNQTCLTIAQLFLFNCVKHQRQGDAASSRHTKDREPPLALYVGLKLHSLTRRKDLVNLMFERGMSVSYDRVIQVCTLLANAVCTQFNAEQVVCPPKFRHGLFVVGMVDNVDHNPTSATAKGSFHGTSLSMLQYPSELNPGQERNRVLITPDLESDRKVMPLLESYASVPPASLHNKEPVVPPTHCSEVLTLSCHDRPVMSKQHDWLSHVYDLFSKESLSEEEYISWAGYHASMTTSNEPINVTLNALLPLFSENAHSVAMIRHSMTVINVATQKLNPGQTPVLAMDQPLFALAKLIQWNWPDTYGEDKFFIMFGGLHIEITAFHTIGDWLADSGWTHLLSEAEIATEGTANSFLKVSHLTKTRHAHQVTAASLYILQRQAYDSYIASSVDTSDCLSFIEWCEKCCQESPQFQYWSLTLLLETYALALVYAEREGNFTFYLDALRNLIPWFFVLNHTLC